MKVKTSLIIQRQNQLKEIIEILEDWLKDKNEGDWLYSTRKRVVEIYKEEFEENKKYIKN